MPVEQTGRGRRPDAGYAGIAVRCIAHEREVIGNQRRLDAELLAHALRIADLLPAAIDLHDPIVAHALGEVLVRRPDPDLVDAHVLLGEMRGGRERVVGFELDHRPHHHAHRDERFFQRMELREQRRLDAGAGLVARPQPVAKGLDDVVGGHADVRGALLDHLQHRLQHPHDRAVGAIRLGEATQAVEVPEELVRAVDEVDDHRPVTRTPRRAAAATRVRAHCGSSPPRARTRRVLRPVRPSLRSRSPRTLGSR